MIIGESIESISFINLNMGGGDGLKCWHSHRKWKQQPARWTQIADLQKCVTKKKLMNQKTFCLCQKIEYFGTSVPFCYYSLLGRVIDFPSRVRVVKKMHSYHPPEVNSLYSHDTNKYFLSYPCSAIACGLFYPSDCPWYVGKSHGKVSTYECKSSEGADVKTTFKNVVVFIP